jgi:hypothetical protein
MKDLERLPDDIYQLFDPEVHHEPSPENLEAFAQNMKDLLKARLSKYNPPSSPLRFSSLGKPNRQMWYEAHPVEGAKEGMLPKTYLKFMYGDIIEQMLLFLAKEAGHSVENEQGTVTIDDVEGHIDAVIDGVVVDVKSASPYGYKKFETRSVTEDDPFGYVAQLSGYAQVLTPSEPAAWLAQDKVSGDICISPLSAIVIRHHDPAERIAELKEIIAQPEPPERCYEDVPDGKSGNRKLGTGCSYCAHKFRCWNSLRTFIYSTGPRYLTHVERVPDVPEVTNVTGLEVDV